MTKKTTNNNLRKEKPPHIRIADTASGMRADKTNTAPCSHRLNTTDICLYVRPHNLPNSIRNATHNANGSNVKFFHLIFLICFSLTPNSELEAYPLTKIIQNVGKTMEPNKLLLDESAKEDRKCEILNTQNGSDGGRAAFKNHGDGDFDSVLSDLQSDSAYLESMGRRF